jgi:hypothetical protein
MTKKAKDLDYISTDRKIRSFFRPFWQKNRGLRQTIYHFILCFFGFLGFFRRKLLSFNNKRRADPFQKNHT